MPFSTRTMTASDWASLTHFDPDEFRAPEKMGWEFMRWLDKVRGDAGVKMVITSSYRTPAENAAAGGAPDSAHIDVPCNAVDIGMRPRPDDPNWNFSRFQIVAAAMNNGCQRIGSYAGGSLHLDRTEDRRPAPRMWRVVGAEKP